MEKQMTQDRKLKSKTEKLSSYNSIAALSASELKKLCLNFDIEIKFPKKAKIIFLCHALGISTTGGQSKSGITTSSIAVNGLSAPLKTEYQSLTPKCLSQQKNWSKDLLKIPEIEESAVKKYLLNSSVLNASSARTYKLSRPFQLKQFVHSVVYFENEKSETFSVIRALCNPSQATNADDVKVVFAVIDKITGEPFGGFCTCTVGSVETCGHIGAVLFKVADILATGSVGEQSITEKLCEWTDPKGSKAPPTVFDEIKIKKNDGQRRRTLKDYGKTVSNTNPPRYDDILNLRASLYDATHHLGQCFPAVHVLNTDRFRTEQPLVPNGAQYLPDCLPFDSEQIAYSLDVEVRSTPTSVFRLERNKFSDTSSLDYKLESERFYNSAKTMNIDFEELNKLTLGQANNSEWHEQRRGSITATKFSSVVRWAKNKKSKCEDLVEGIIGNDNSFDKLKNVSAIKWGRKNESKARQAYINKFQHWHKNFKVTEHGLMVYSELNFIRGSPDGIVHCSCHGRRLLEIKCPWSARTMTVLEAVINQKIKYLEQQNGRFVLKQGTKDGYYEQVQGLMGMMNIKDANLVVWTEKDMVTVHIPFNSDFFYSVLVPACSEFFRMKVIPGLLLEELCGENDKHSNTDTEIAKIPNPISSDNKENETSCAMSILRENTTYSCEQCNKILPDENISPDNSNASVGCDCPNCGGCDVWFCWPCAKYDEDWASEGINWYCPNCTRNCDIIY